MASLTPQQRRDRSRVWAKRNPEWNEFLRGLRRRGITLDQYHAINERQDFACAICEKDTRPLVMDHCHQRGHVRGLLCRLCNSGVGMLQDSPELVERALDYVRRVSA